MNQSFLIGVRLGRCQLALTLTLLLLACCPVHARAQAPTNSTFTFQIDGRSPSWEVVLHGYGVYEKGDIKIAEVRPIVTWRGDDGPPQQYTAQFSVQNLRCGPVTVSRQVPKTVSLPICKLRFPGEPSLSAKTPEEIELTIISQGRFSLQWDDRSESITWRTPQGE